MIVLPPRFSFVCECMQKANRRAIKIKLLTACHGQHLDIFNIFILISCIFSFQQEAKDTKARLVSLQIAETIL